MLYFRRKWHYQNHNIVVNSKRVIVQKNTYIVISNIEMQMNSDIPVLFEKWNSLPISYTNHA